MNFDLIVSRWNGCSSNCYADGSLAALSLSHKFRGVELGGLGKWNRLDIAVQHLGADNSSGYVACHFS